MLIPGNVRVNWQQLYKCLRKVCYRGKTTNKLTQQTKTKKQLGTLMIWQILTFDTVFSERIID